MLLIIYIIISFIIMGFIFKYSTKYGVNLFGLITTFDNIKKGIIKTILAISYIYLTVLYLNISNPDSKLYYIYFILKLDNYSTYLLEIQYFCITMAVIYFFMLIFFSFKSDPQELQKRQP